MKSSCSPPLRRTLLNISSYFSSIWTILESFRLLNIFSERKLRCLHVPRYQYIWKQGDRKVWSYIFIIFGQILLKKFYQIQWFNLLIEKGPLWSRPLSLIFWVVVIPSLLAPSIHLFIFWVCFWICIRICQTQPKHLQIVRRQCCLGERCEVALNLILIRVRCKFPPSSPRPPVNRANRGGIRHHSTQLTLVLRPQKPSEDSKELLFWSRCGLKKN